MERGVRGDGDASGKMPNDFGWNGGGALGGTLSF